jgi:hypothetical protein
MLPFFGSCVIYILYTGVLKVKRKFQRLKVQQYDNYRGRLPAKDSYQVTAYIFSQYSSPLVDFPTLQLGFFQK